MEGFDYRPNSHKLREGQKESGETRKPIEKIVKGNVRTQKKSEIRKFADVFISEDIRNVKSYVLRDVLVPIVKDALEDIVIKGLRMLLRGEAGTDQRKTNADRVSYTPYYNSRERDRFAPSSGPAARSIYDLNNITLENRADAEAVLRQLDAIIETYGVARVADLYDLLGITGEHTDNKYGWTNLRNAEAVPVKNGYLLRLPRVIPIN